MAQTLAQTLAHDADLIAWLDASAHGDADALKRLYDATAPRLYGLAMQVLREPEAAQDVLQEAFLQVWRSAGDYRAALSPPLAWLGMIVRSRALDALRRRKAQRSDRSVPLQAQDDDDGPDLLDQLAAPDAGPDERLQHSQLAASLQHCLAKLDRKQRQVVQLAYLRDLSHSEMAAQLAAPLGTVKSWARRGLAQLRDCLQAFTRGGLV
jgi:RNA polymerase sigma factor (sigma-70 family)